MHWNRSATDVATLWQAEIESKLETGAAALLLAGAPDTLISSTTTLLAQQQSTMHRNDTATPLLVAGGNSALWLGLLMSPHPTGSDLHAPAPTLVYGGGDEATYLAIVSLTAAQSAQPLISPTRTTTPLEMGIHFAPRLQPGAVTAWEMLPLLEVGEQATSSVQGGMPGKMPGDTHGAIHGQPSMGVGSTGDTAGDPTGDWIVWGIMLVAFCLVVSALLI